jgi:aerobic carbon-monoxide dehydrogenase large subunit
MPRARSADAMSDAVKSGSNGRNVTSAQPSVARLEDGPLLRGKGNFVDDIRLPGMLEAAFVRSAEPHALIRGIDVAAALALPGVHAVLTLADIRPHITTERLVVGLPSPAYRQQVDRMILAGEETVHVGEPIAIVVADSRYIAEDAAALVEVNYEPLPAASDCRAALADDAPRVHRSAPHNLAAEFALGYGEVDQVFARAPRTLRRRLSLHRGGSHSMECRGLVARYDELEDRLTLWSSTQTPHAARQMLCDLLGRHERQVRVIAPDIGGGFGPKLVFYSEEIVTCLAAMRLGRPIKWIEDRREHFVATTQERDQYWDVEIAFDDDARILGVRGTLIHDHGAYTARGVNVPYGSVAAMPLAYDIPAYRMEIKLALTNKVPVTPVRGAGQPQGVFAMERLIDAMARELGLDRAEVRRRNLVAADKMPYARPLTTRGNIQVVLDSGDYPLAQQKALGGADWAGFPARQQAARAAGRHLGIGIANYVEGTGRGPYEPVTVRIGPSGKVQVHSSAVAMGQSTNTMLAEIVAAQLGGDLASLAVTTGDTDAIALGFGGFNSRQAVMAGSSAHVAAIAVRRKLLKVAGQMLEAAEQDLEIDKGAVRVKGSDLRVTFADVARAASGQPGYRLPKDIAPGMEATEHVVIDPMTYSNGCAVVEVEVDADTGAVTVRRIVFVHDCGNVINATIVDGQVIGGAVHGLGNALYEHMRFDDGGQPLTTNFADYLLPTATETPAIEMIHMCSPTPLNPLGIKGVGESGVLPIAAAVASAIDDALAPLGVEVTHAPVSPVEILDLVRQRTVTDAH